MPDSLHLIGNLVWVVVIAALVWHQLWANAARRRQDVGLCTRCGKAPADSESPELHSHTTMCTECRQVTLRNYNLGSWFFYSITGLFGLIAPFVLLPEAMRSGAHAVLEDAELFILLIGMSAGAGFCIRHFGRKNL